MRRSRDESFRPFNGHSVDVAGNSIFVRQYGKGPAILLVHGFPRTSLMSRFLAPALAETHSAICVDLGGGGPLDTFYVKDGGPLGIWRQWAPRAHGQAMKGGHFFPEENPADTARLVNQFLAA